MKESRNKLMSGKKQKKREKAEVIVNLSFHLWLDIEAII